MNAAFGASIASLQLWHCGETVPAWLALVPQTAIAVLAKRPEHFLSNAELVYFRALGFERRRSSYLLGRYAAKLALAQCLGEVALSRIDVHAGVFGQPVVRYASESVPGVSISHCDGLAAAVAFRDDHILGVDVEHRDPLRVDLLATCLDDTELASLDALGYTFADACYLSWTAREALSKALRCGLTLPLEALALEASERDPASEGCRSRFRQFGQYQAQSWQLGKYWLSVVLPKRSELRGNPCGFLRGREEWL